MIATTTKVNMNDAGVRSEVKSFTKSVASPSVSFAHWPKPDIHAELNAALTVTPEERDMVGEADNRGRSQREPIEDDGEANA